MHLEDAARLSYLWRTSKKGELRDHDDRDNRSIADDSRPYSVAPSSYRDTEQVNR